MKIPVYSTGSYAASTTVLAPDPAPTRRRGGERLPHGEERPGQPQVDRAAANAVEERRWLLTLGVPFAVAASFLAAAIGSGVAWLMGPAIVIGPILMVVGYVYLSVSSDTNMTEPRPTRSAGTPRQGTLSL